MHLNGNALERATFPTGRLSRRRCHECEGSPLGFGNPLFDQLPPDIKMQVAQQCASEACQTAKFRLQQIRDEFERKCPQVQRLYRDWQSDTQIALSLLAAFYTLVALASVCAALSFLPFVGEWVEAAGTALLVLAFFALLAAYLFWQVISNPARDSFNNAQNALDQILARFRQQASEVVSA